MVLINRIAQVALVVAGFCLISPSPVYAYLDPGTGSYVIQLLIGALLGLGFLVKMNWAKVKEFFRKKSGSMGEDDTG